MILGGNRNKEWTQWASDIKETIASFEIKLLICLITSSRIEEKKWKGKKKKKLRKERKRKDRRK